MAYKDPVEARVKGAAASPAIQAEAERLLPCKHPTICGMHTPPGLCCWHDCETRHRPAVASALQALTDQIDRLRADLAGRDASASCEGCGAPLFDGDDFVSSEDCSGCWYAMTDVPSKRERPCYAYRVGKTDACTALNQGERCT